MSDPDGFERVKRDIAVIASLIARQRQLVDQMRARGHDTGRVELILESLAELYRRKLQARQALKEQVRSAGSSSPPERQHDG